LKEEEPQAGHQPRTGRGARVGRAVERGMHVVVELGSEVQQLRAVSGHVGTARTLADGLPQCAALDECAVGLGNRRVEVQRSLLMVVQPWTRHWGEGQAGGSTALDTPLG
jgi:hypothetical protein